MAAQESAKLHEVDGKGAEVLLELPPELEARLLAWVGEQSGVRPRMQDAILQLLDQALGSPPRGSAEDPHAAGQAAFATYGEAGRPINPHGPHSRERAVWNDGFQSAKETRDNRLQAVTEDREDKRQSGGRG